MKTREIEARIRELNAFDEKMVIKNQSGGFPEMIDKILAEKGVSRADIICMLNCDRNYGYQILNGTRNPTRRQIVQIGLYLGLDCGTVQKLLTLGGRSALYVRRPEDARIFYCLEHKMDYGSACEFIWGKDE